MFLVYVLASIIGMAVTAWLLPQESLLLSVPASLLGGNLLALAAGLIIVQWRFSFRQEGTIRSRGTVGRKDAVPQGVVWC
jgi:hypothetical protein